MEVISKIAGRAFFDTNVLIYLLEDDPRSQRSAELLERGGIISVQVLNEFVNACRGKKRLPYSRIGEILQRVRALCEVVPVTADFHDQALRLAERYNFHFYDALIVAAALDTQCGTLYTEDLQDGQLLEKRLRVVNPFV